MNPPVNSDLNREALAGGITIEGLNLPEGTNIGYRSRHFIITRRLSQTLLGFGLTAGLTTSRLGRRQPVLPRVSQVLPLFRSGLVAARVRIWPTWK